MCLVRDTGQYYLYSIVIYQPVPHLLPLNPQLVLSLPYHPLSTCTHLLPLSMSWTPGWDYIYSVIICQPVPYLLPLNMLWIPASTISTVLPCICLYHICFPWIAFGPRLVLYLQYHHEYHICFPWVWCESPASTIFTVSAFVSLYHICLFWIVFGPWPLQYLQYHHGSACTIFAVQEDVLYPQLVLYLQHYH